MGSNRLIDSCTSSETTSDCRLGQSDDLSDPVDGSLFPIEFIEPHRALGSPLLALRDPLAILRGIVAVRIDAFDGVASRLHAHVGQEILKGMSPPVAHRDAPPAVVGVGVNVLVDTARDHGFPDSVGRSLGHVMSAVALGRRFSAPTAAALRIAAPEFNGIDGYGGAAVASANTARNYPSAFVPVRSRVLENDEPSKSLAGVVVGIRIGDMHVPIVE